MAAYLVASPCYHFHLHQSSRNQFILRWSGSVFLSFNDFVLYCDGRMFPWLLRSVIIWKWIKMIHAPFRGFFFFLFQIKMSDVKYENVNWKAWWKGIFSEAVLLVGGIYLLSLELVVCLTRYRFQLIQDAAAQILPKIWRKKRIMSLQLLHNLCWLWTAFRKHFRIFLLVDKAFNIFLSLSLHC